MEYKSSIIDKNKVFNNENFNLNVNINNNYYGSSLKSDLISQVLGIIYNIKPRC